MDYTILYKSSYEGGNIDCNGGYDLFLSGFDNCERTKLIFERINSREKVWLLFPHYHIPEEDLDAHTKYYFDPSFKEDEYFINFFENFEILNTTNICIDITGLIRPHLAFLTKYLFLKGIKKIDFLYSEPQYYINAEDTAFSGFIDEVKIIEGCGAEDNNPDTDNDVLIITAGYDDKLTSKICQSKSKIKHRFYILGFPSLQPDMYQESVLKMYYAKESIGSVISKYAPAFDPFVTAQTIQEIINSNALFSNIYLSPLSTKPQALGIVLYYLWNYQDKPINIIYPYSNYYYPKTAHGLKKTWKYSLQFP